MDRVSNSSDCLLILRTETVFLQRLQAQDSNPGQQNAKRPYAMGVTPGITYKMKNKEKQTNTKVPKGRLVKACFGHTIKSDILSPEVIDIIKQDNTITNAYQSA